MNSAHDVGGMDGLGPVLIEENEPPFHEPWEGRVRALSTLLSRKLKIYQIDESRYTIERINPVYYFASSYYQKWLLRTETLLVERGVLSEKEIEEKIAELDPDRSISCPLKAFRSVTPPVSSTHRRTVIEITSGGVQKEQIVPKYNPGTVVRVKAMSPTGHTRAPRYVRGKTGVIEQIHGSFVLPDVKVHDRTDFYQTVYRVSFNAQELWGEDASPTDKLYIELWEDYIELAGVQNENH